ncbi:MAG: transcription termination/antitermination NusG family protein [Chloroflexota bacterium]|nr:transcription termination/antitermination NusG family protein [Chloroflexota bacterium]
MTPSWYVLHSKPNREDFLYSQLLHRDLRVFYPQLQVNPVNPRSRKVKPFFPGYLFVNIDLEGYSLSRLCYIPGANRVVSFDQVPAIVPNSVIKSIKQNVDRINKTPRAQIMGLKHGDPVIIRGGPFEGYHAIFDTALEGSERVRLLVALLRNQQVRIQLPAQMARPVNP